MKRFAMRYWVGVALLVAAFHAPSGSAGEQTTPPTPAKPSASGSADSKPREPDAGAPKQTAKQPPIKVPVAAPPKPQVAAPPKLPVEVPVPLGVKATHIHPLTAVRLADLAAAPLPERLENAVAFTRPFKPYPATPDAGKLQLEVETAGPVYLAVTWQYDGPSDISWRRYVWTDYTFMAQGWLPLSIVPLRDPIRKLTEPHTVYLKYCAVGDKLDLRTRRQTPPLVLLVPGETSSAASLAPLDPNPAFPEELQRQFVGAKNLALLKAECFDELEAWTDRLLRTSAVFPSGHYQIRSVGKAFESRTTSIRPGFHEECLPLLERWLAKYPQSNSAKLVTASVLIEYSHAVRIRGKEANKLVEAETARRRAMELLYEVEQADKTLPHMYFEYMALAREEKWDEELATEYFNRAVDSGSWCPQAVGEFLQFLRDRYDDDPAGARLMQAHLQRAVAATRDRYGDMMYAASIMDYQSKYPERPFTIMGFEWPRLKASFDEVLVRYPNSTRIVRAYCKLAAVAGDRETALRQFKRLGPYRADDDEGWTDPLEYALNQIWARDDFTSGDQIGLWNLSLQGAVGLQWTRDKVLYLDRRGAIYQFDPESGKQTAIFSQGDVFSTAFAADQAGELVVRGAWYGSLDHARTSRPSVFYRLYTKATATISALAVSRDARRIAVGVQGGKVFLLATEGKMRLLDERSVAAGKAQWVHYVGFTPDGNTLITYADGDVKLWDAETLAMKASWTADKQRGLSAELSPDGKTLATSGGEGSVKLWEIPGGRALGEIPNVGNRIGPMCFSADGRRLATGAGYVEELLPAEIKLLDVAARTTLKTFHGHKATVSGLAFAPDGKTLLSVSLDRSARVWQVPNE